jgi:hypothetical protein
MIEHLHASSGFAIPHFNTINKFYVEMIWRSMGNMPTTFAVTVYWKEWEISISLSQVRESIHLACWYVFKFSYLLFLGGGDYE